MTKIRKYFLAKKTIFIKVYYSVGLQCIIRYLFNIHNDATLVLYTYIVILYFVTVVTKGLKCKF